MVAEQRPDASEEDSFQWMSRVLQVSPVIQVDEVSLCSVWADQRPPACYRWREHRLMIPLGTRYFYKVASWVHLLCTSCSVMS